MSKIQAACQAATDSAEAEERVRKEELHRLESHAKERDLSILRNVPYDGDCFFSAVTALTNWEHPHMLRRQLAGFTKSKVNSET